METLQHPRRRDRNRHRTGLVTTVTLIILCPQVWPGDADNAPVPLTFPVLVSIPVGFLGCWIGTIIGKPDPSQGNAFTKLRVRSQVGLGAEESPPARIPTRPQLVRTDMTGEME
ncbi:possible Na+ dependent symporter protein [Rhodococcus jostii RHA1]|uniref:Possible Na+ dependent symporter protein n=1 Tax=Rhodococcus jostii (strain RHA1) TaxID=101510 RepID=Q0SD42_RHOJR|nr:Na+ dependent symporter protein [Rhodococcus jostii]ABG94544.1 possible Na+ dependent symporter protein [Rhodococcus jostii RHA1]